MSVNFSAEEKIFKSICYFSIKFLICISVFNFLIVKLSFSQVAEDLAKEESVKILDLKSLETSESVILSNQKVRELIKLAMDLSPFLKEAEFNAAATIQEIKAARGARLPRVIATGQSNFSWSDIPNAAVASGTPSLTLSATAPIYDWGQITATIKGREAARDAAWARYDSLTRQLAVEVVTLCLEVNKRVALLDATRTYQSKLRNLFNMLLKIKDADPGRAGEFVQTESRLLQSQLQEETFISSLKEIEIRLSRIIGKNQSKKCEGIGPGFISIPKLESLRDKIESHPQLKTLEALYQQQLRNLDAITASRKPRVNVTAARAPVSPGISNLYANSLAFTVTAPVYDGRILQSTQRATLERASGAAERKEQFRRQFDAQIREQFKQAEINLYRADKYVKLIEVSDRVRADFFLQWSSLGRKSLFQLLAIESEQYGLQSNYYQALYTGMTSVARISGDSGLLTEDMGLSE